MPDRLILYNDGLVEVFNSLDEMLGVEGLEDFVLQSATLTLAGMQKTILNGVAAWSHGPLADDVSSLSSKSVNRGFRIVPRLVVFYSRFGRMAGCSQIIESTRFA